MTLTAMTPITRMTGKASFIASAPASTTGHSLSAR
jgi:hypothetical protein